MKPIAVISLVWMAVWVDPVGAQTESDEAKNYAESYFADAMEAVKAGDTDKSYTAFQNALRAADRSRDSDWANEFRFGVAATIQGSAPRGEIQVLSIRAYRQLLESGVQVPAVWNNLAKQYEAYGRADPADSLYRLAAWSDDPRAGVYKSNYADFLVSEGRFEEATELYLILLRDDPGDLRANRGLVNIYLETQNFSSLADYCWGQLRNGATAKVLDVSQTAMMMGDWGESGPLPWGWSGEYASIVASGLAGLDVEPTRYEQLPIVAALRETVFHDGLEQLYRLLPDTTSDAAELSPEMFTWWATHGLHPGTPNRVRSPLDSFRSLAKRIASWYRDVGQTAVADRYFGLAADIGLARFEDVDEEAVLELAEIRFARSDSVGLREIANTYEGPLFSEKAIWYQTGDYQRIYTVQRALGYMYAQLGSWGSEGQVGTANFHLKEAIRAADIYNSENPEEPILVSPEIINLRARSFQEMGDASDAVDFQLQYAEKLAERGQVNTGKLVYDDLLRRVDTSKLSAAETERLSKLKATVETNRQIRRKQ